LLSATLNRLAKVLQGFVRNVELFVFGPTEVSFGLSHGIGAGSVAVRFARPGGRHSESDNRLHADQGRLVFDGLRVADSGFDGLQVIAIFDRRSMPTIRFKPLWNVLGKSQLRETFDRHLVVVV